MNAGIGKHDVSLALELAQDASLQNMISLRPMGDMLMLWSKHESVVLTGCDNVGSDQPGTNKPGTGQTT